MTLLREKEKKKKEKKSGVSGRNNDSWVRCCRLLDERRRARPTRVLWRGRFRAPSLGFLETGLDKSPPAAFAAPEMEQGAALGWGAGAMRAVGTVPVPGGGLGTGGLTAVSLPTQVSEQPLTARPRWIRRVP